MKVTYKNRYGDDIVFEKIDDKTVKMSGYNPDWVRFGWENDFTRAYDLYVTDCSELEEPDHRLLIEDVKQSKVRPLTLKEFRDKFYQDIDWSKPENPFNKYYKLITPDVGNYSMVDPSGGPYICKRSNLKYYFESKEDMIVDHIDFGSNDHTQYTLFTIK